MTPRRTALAALAVLFACGTAAACGGDDDATGETDAGGLSTSGDDESTQAADVPDDVVVLDGTRVEVTALDNTFRPQNVQVRPGTSVAWTNDGRNEHDVLPVDDAAWGAEVEDFQPGDVYEHTFDQAGVYDYYCSIHGTTTAGMIGTIVVAD